MGTALGPGIMEPLKMVRLPQSVAQSPSQCPCTHNHYHSIIKWHFIPQNCRVKKELNRNHAALSTKKTLKTDHSSVVLSSLVWRWGRCWEMECIFAEQGGSCNPPCSLNVLAADSSALMGCYLPAVLPASLLGQTVSFQA